MSYQVLARKYRPQRFADVIGQEHVTRTLQNAIAQQRDSELRRSNTVERFACLELLRIELTQIGR